MTPRSGPGGDIELRGIGRRFGAHAALVDVSVRLRGGSTMTLLGPNGAGKSTLLRILSGGIRPSSGDVLRAGERLDARSRMWRSRIGVLSHRTHLYAALTARENLKFFGTLQGVSTESAQVERALDRVGLADRANEPVSGFSRGMRQRLALARTLFHDPDIVLLDEPFTGLDAQASTLLEGVLRQLHDGLRTVVLVTHALGEGLALADQVVVLSRGRVVLDRDATAIEPATFAEQYRSLVRAPA